MSPRGARWPAAVLLALLAVVPGVAACAAGGGDAGPADAEAAARASARTPSSAEALADLLVTEVPSGLSRVPDADVDPPAGEKSLEDVAGYAEDPAHERVVLTDYGYRHGWERFWGTPGGRTTSVFVDQFDSAPGAAAYARDLVRDGADYYSGLLQHNPSALPDGCRLLTVEHPDPRSGVTGPAAFAWCAQGVFTVAVSAVTGSPQGALAAATDEVAAVVEAQLTRLPG